MNQFYDVGAEALLQGTVNLVADPVMVVPRYGDSFDPYIGTLADLHDKIAVAPQPLQGRALTNRALYADDTNFPAIAESYSLRSLALWVSGADILIAHIDRRPDLAPIYLVGNGGPVLIQWGGGSGLVVRL